MPRVLKYTGTVGRSPMVFVTAPGSIVYSEMTPLEGQQADWLQVVIWVEESNETEDVTRILQIYGTGQTFPEGFDHIRTVRDGFFIWHLYGRTA